VNAVFYFVAVAAGLALVGLLFWLLRRRPAQNFDHNSGRLDKVLSPVSDMPRFGSPWIRPILSLRTSAGAS
jgi:hypothetical protein